MDSARRRVTVFDIARAAHVSIATVDRALKGRDGISPATAARVLSVAAELGWQPNMAAQGLSRRVPLDIRVLLPDDDNPFIRQLQRIVGDLRDEFLAFRIDPSVETYPSLDSAALAAAIDRHAGSKGVGLAVVALQDPAVGASIDRAVESGVPVVTLLSDVQNCARQAYVGMDNFAAGRTAGALLGWFVGRRDAQLCIFGGSELYQELALRVAGCGEVLAARFPSTRLLPVQWNVEHAGPAREAARNLLATHRDLSAIYVAGGGLFGVAEALAEAGRAGSTILIGHDMAGGMRELLRNGTVNAVICQNPYQQVRRGIRLAALHASGTAVTEPPAFAEIEIVIDESAPESFGRNPLDY